MDEKATDAALAEARKALSVWQSSEAFIKRVEETGALLESALLFNKPNVNFLLDAMVLAEFMKLRPPGQARLPEERENWPDGLIGDPKAPTNIEITEVMEPGRRRGDEYREAKRVDEKRDDRPDNWRAIAQKIPAALEEGIRKKIGKRYAVKPILLIYLNMNEYGLLQKETEHAIAELKAKHADQFQEICVIWKDRLY